MVLLSGSDLPYTFFELTAFLREIRVLGLGLLGGTFFN